MKRDNRGVSLVEIIVAITILAVCAVPLFKSMIFSTELNTKSRTLFSATNAAEAVMENLKADGMERFIEENKDGGQIEEVRYLDEDNKEEGYCFVYPRYPMDQKEFRIQVEVRPYQNIGDSANDYNRKEIVNIDRMNRATDAIYIEEKETAEEDYLKAAAAGEVAGGEEVLENLEVHYHYDVTEEEGRQRVEQTVSYLYQGRSIGEHFSILYDSGQTDGALYNLYIFFEPNLKNVITVNNLQDYPLEVYLVKQGKKKMDLEVQLYGTALLQNLGEEKDPDFTRGTRFRTNFMDASDQTDYSYMRKGTMWSHLTEADLEKYFAMKFLDAKKMKYRLYHVTVQVMEDGEQITELTGTVAR